MLIGNPVIVSMEEPTEEKKTTNMSIFEQFLNMAPPRHRRHISKDFRNSIYRVSKEMNEKIKARMRRDVLVNKFEHSDEPALRVFASQLDLAKY